MSTIYPRSSALAPRIVNVTPQVCLPQDSDQDSEDSLQDKDPPPRTVTMDSLHLSNSRSQQTTKGTGERSGNEEETEPLLGLIALVPHGEKIETSPGPGVSRVHSVRARG